MSAGIADSGCQLGGRAASPWLALSNRHERKNALSKPPSFAQLLLRWRCRMRTALVLMSGAAALVMAAPTAARAEPGASECRNVVITTSDGSVYARSQEIIAWRLGCKRARQVVREYLRRVEGTPSSPRPFGFRCQSGAAGGLCQKRRKRVWWIHSPTTSISCRYPDAPYPCPGERPCGRVTTVSEGARVRSWVFYSRVRVRPRAANHTTRPDP